jgi:hypothetical protein
MTIQRNTFGSWSDRGGAQWILHNGIDGDIPVDQSVSATLGSSAQQVLFWLVFDTVRSDSIE